MEVIAFFLFVLVFVLPIVALAKARSARQAVEAVSRRLWELEAELRALRNSSGFTDSAPYEKPSELPAESASDFKTEPNQARESSEERVSEGALANVDVHPQISAPVAGPPAILEAAKIAGPSNSATADAGPEPGLDPGEVPDPKSKGLFDLPLEKVNWEQFMGVRLFSWLGGLALFLAAAFFVRYSFEHNLISPEVRIAIGFLAGLGLLICGVRISAKPYRVTAHTLLGAGVVILYAVTFAGRAVYHFPLFGPGLTFAMMVLITATAFLLAVRLDALFVAVLGMLGGFLTPILVSTGQDNPAALFTYIALLDIGLLCVASVRRWDWLSLASAIATVLMQFGWVSKFFAAEKVFVAMAVFLVFNALYLAAYLWASPRDEMNRWVIISALLLPAGTFLFDFVLIGNGSTGLRPGVLFSFILGADLCLLAIAVLCEQLRNLPAYAGAIVFLQLAVWTGTRVSDALLYWALAGYLGFAVLHAALPIWISRRFPERSVSPWCQLFPVISLAFVILPIVKLDSISFGVWPVIVLMNAAVIGLAVLTASIAGILYALLVTAGLAFVWLIRVPSQSLGLAEPLIVIGGFAVVFTLAGVFAGRKILASSEGAVAPSAAGLLPEGWVPVDVQKQIPALSAILPFLLLIMVTVRVPAANPSPVFGMALLLCALMLGLTRFARMELLPGIALGCAFLLEHTWHSGQFQSGSANLVFCWYLVFYTGFAVFPLLFLKSDADRLLSWVVSAVAGPLQFYLIYDLIKRAWPFGFMGLIPAAFAVPTIAGLLWVLRRIPSEHSNKNTILAWYGGVALLFITLVFPIQFERQWLTLAWALEGAALLWLFHRIPHHGLRYVGVGLLGVAFIRLALNPAVLEYHMRAAVPVFNWYLYAYAVVAGCLFGAARLLNPPNERVFGRDARPWLCALGAVLVFLLMNIEIADFFSEPGARVLTFRFSGNLARDLSYSIGWALFALALLVTGLARRLRAVRLAGIGLLAVTLLKLFFHDLAVLNQLYRVGALLGVAIIAIVASFLYQKFLAAELAPKTGPP